MLSVHSHKKIDYRFEHDTNNKNKRLCFVEVMFLSINLQVIYIYIHKHVCAVQTTCIISVVAANEFSVCGSFLRQKFIWLFNVCVGLPILVLMNLIVLIYEFISKIVDDT